MAVIAQQARSAGNRYASRSAAASEPVAALRSTNRPGSAPGRADGLSNPGRSDDPRKDAQPKFRGQTARSGHSSKSENTDAAGGPAKPEPEILFQKYFKSVGPRTYAAQLKRAANGNHFLVLTESKRDEKTNEPRKTRLFIYSEDFVAYFRMLHETAQFIRQNPVPEKIRKRQELRWSRKRGAGRQPTTSR